MQVRIRAARESDYDRLCVLWEELDRFHAAIQPDFFRSPPHPRPRSDLRLALRDEQREIFIALDEMARPHEIVGAVQLHLYDVSHQPMMLPGRRAYVEDLVVSDRCRGQRIGAQLMEVAQHWSERRGAHQVVLTVWDGNDSALAFYDAIGYRPINRVLVHDID